MAWLRKAGINKNITVKGYPQTADGFFITLSSAIRSNSCNFMHRPLLMKRLFSFLLITLCGQQLLGQYTLNGSATQDACNQYTLTPAAGTRSGSVWNNNKIDLTQSFDFKFDVFLGYNNSPGADGIVFVLQPISTSVGTTGGGLGYENISPAIGVTIDTYQNSGNADPAFDHIAIQLNGNLSHNNANNIAGPVTAIDGNDNIEDGKWHALRITWDAFTKTITAYVDGVQRVTAVKDLVTDVLAGNPLVYWGFTGSTGGEFNLQQFRTALNPSFHFGPAQKRCVNEPIQFLDSTVSFTTIAKFYWDFGDGSPLDSVHLNPVHAYILPGDYTIKQRVIGADGCEATNIQTVRVGSIPIANILSNSTNCNPAALVLSDQSAVAVGTINAWYWDFGNGTFSNIQNPLASYTTAGIKTINLSVTSVEGCVGSTVKTIPVGSTPSADFSFTDSVCLGQPTQFSAIVLPTAGDNTIKWNWNIDGGLPGFLNNPNPSYTFTTPGIHNVILLAEAETYVFMCFTVVSKTIYVRDKPHAAVKNPIICPKVQTILEDSSYTADGIAISGHWWDLGNGQFSTQKNPSVTYTTAGPFIIQHVVTDARGCISDTLKQTIYLQAPPVANFGYNSPVCEGLTVQFSDSSTTIAGSTIQNWSWKYAGTTWSTQQHPGRTFAAGNQTISLIVTDDRGCVSDAVNKILYVNPQPDVTMNFKDACKKAPVSFTAADNSGTVTQWQWVFGDGAVANAQNAQHVYTANGTYKVQLIASAATGCYSGSLQKDITIYGTNAFAGNDTIAAAGQPVQLHASGGLSYAWSPVTGLSDPSIANPIAVINSTQTYSIKAFTPEGCESYAYVTINIYKGPDLYLPTAFTPNGDGLNDVFRVIPVGIKQFNYLKIYNRWGKEVFSTSNYNNGWNGNWQGQQQNSGAFIVIASAVDFMGNTINKKQTVLLIR